MSNIFNKNCQSSVFWFISLRDCVVGQHRTETKPFIDLFLKCNFQNYGKQKATDLRSVTWMSLNQIFRRQPSQLAFLILLLIWYKPLWLEDLLFLQHNSFPLGICLSLPWKIHTLAPLHFFFSTFWYNIQCWFKNKLLSSNSLGLLCCSFSSWLFLLKTEAFAMKWTIQHVKR